MSHINTHVNPWKALKELYRSIKIKKARIIANCLRISNYKIQRMFHNFAIVICSISLICL